MTMMVRTCGGLLLRSCRCLVLGMLVLLAAGCSGGTGTVTGQVTFNGQPLPLGTITFHAEQGDHEVSNALIRDGSYSVDGVRAGPTKVTVVTVDTAQVGAPPTEAGGARDKGDGLKPAPKKPSSNFVALPKHYGDPNNSGLSLEVHQGTQTFNVELKP
jgi:hypothetical protein